MPTIPNSTDLLVVMQGINTEATGFFGVAILFMVVFVAWAAITVFWDTQRAIVGATLIAAFSSIFLYITGLLGLAWVIPCVILAGASIYWIKAQE